VVRFAPQVAQNVAEVAWHRTQKTVPLPDGSLDFCVRVSGLSEISWWILGYGDQAEVLEPPALRELIAARAERIVARYRGRTERGRGGRGREARASAREAGRRRT
jgi:proteasome accessory factor B